MPKIAGILADTLLRSAATNDGCHVVLQLRTADGDEVNIAIPREQVGEHIDHLAFGASRTEEIIRHGQHLRSAVTWWTSSVDRGTGSLALTLTFGQGGTFCFEFTEHMAKALLTSLCGFYGADTSLLAEPFLSFRASTNHIEPGFVDEG
jgi:hypothetical protein